MPASCTSAPSDRYPASGRSSGDSGGSGSACNCRSACRPFSPRSIVNHGQRSGSRCAEQASRSRYSTVERDLADTRRRRWRDRRRARSTDAPPAPSGPVEPCAQVRILPGAPRRRCQKTPPPAITLRTGSSRLCSRTPLEAAVCRGPWTSCGRDLEPSSQVGPGIGVAGRRPPRRTERPVSFARRHRARTCGRKLHGSGPPGGRSRRPSGPSAGL